MEFNSENLLTTAQAFFADELKKASKDLGYMPPQNCYIYLVDLLNQSVTQNEPLFLDEMLSVKILSAQNESIAERKRILRLVGDHSLCLSGLFSSSLKRKVVDVDFYEGMGRLAFDQLSSSHQDKSGVELFSLLSQHFSQIVSLLSCLGDTLFYQYKQDILRLHDLYGKTQSKYALKKLIELGQIPVDQKIKAQQ